VNAPCVSTSTRLAQLDELEWLSFVNVSFFPFRLKLVLAFAGTLSLPARVHERDLVAADRVAAFSHQIAVDRHLVVAGVKLITHVPFS
jgi:hypothetical protein